MAECTRTAEKFPWVIESRWSRWSVTGLTSIARIELLRDHCIHRVDGCRLPARVFINSHVINCWANEDHMRKRCTYLKSQKYCDPIISSMLCILYFKAHYLAFLYGLGTRSSRVPDLQEHYLVRTKHYWHSVRSLLLVAWRYGVRTKSTNFELST